MKRTLSELTMAQYIDLLCGDMSSLKESPHEVLNENEANKARRDIVYEYTLIASPAEAKSWLTKHKGAATDKMRYLLFYTLKNLVAIGAYDEVKGVLSDYGMNVSGYDDERVKSVVESTLKRAASDIERRKLQATDVTALSPAEIRTMYEKQAASLMTYFRFQIDLGTIKASSFAYMVEQANREIKARMAAMKRH